MNHPEFILRHSVTTPLAPSNSMDHLPTPDEDRVPSGLAELHCERPLTNCGSHKFDPGHFAIVGKLEMESDMRME